MTKTRKQQLVWKHNSFFGHVAMSKAQMQNIINAKTTTRAAQDKAFAILQELTALGELLKKRIDP